MNREEMALEILKRSSEQRTLAYTGILLASASLLLGIYAIATRSAGAPPQETKSSSPASLPSNVSPLRPKEGA